MTTVDSAARRSLDACVVRRADPLDVNGKCPACLNGCLYCGCDVPQ